MGSIYSLLSEESYLKLYVDTLRLEKDMGTELFQDGEKSTV